MKEDADDRTLPPDDDSPGHTLARFRQLLRRRRDDAAVKLLEVSDRLYTAQVRANKATLPEEKVLALVQSLTYSAEAHLLTLEEGYRYVDRLTAALQAAETWTDSTRRLESVATDWDARLTAAREVWARAGEEIPLQVAEASGQVLRSVLEENRAALRWLLGLAAILAILSSVASFLSWRTHALVTAQAAVSTSEARPGSSHGPHRP
jgi:hypothetical protein